MIARQPAGGHAGRGFAAREISTHPTGNDEASTLEQRSQPDDRGRGWWTATVALGVLALLSRILSTFTYPPLHDFDGPGHALNVLAFYEGRLPDPASWVGFHAPLYHAVGAALWHLAPDCVPVHTLLRLLSMAAGAMACWLAVRGASRVAPPLEAAVAGVFAFCVASVAVATAMLGNETTCALFATAALLRLVGEGPGRAAARETATSDLRHAAITGALAGLAALAKSTGLLVAGVVALIYLLRLRAEPARALRVALIAGGVAALVASPHYLRLAIRSGGEPLAVITGAALSPELAAEMASQPPGERHLGDYLLLPPAMLFAPVHAAPGMERSVPGLLYASLFADGHAQYLPASVRPVLLAEVILALLGLLPTALAGFGFWLVLRDPARRGALRAPLLFLVLLLASWLRYTWMLPTFAAVKASYLLPALLAPVAALAVGLSWFEGRARAVLRAALLGIAALSAAVTTWGWWE